MSYNGITITEPGILHVVAVGFLALLLTYPLSLILIRAGVINNYNRGLFDRANEIAKSQLLFSFVAWVVAAGFCYLALFAWMIVLGFLFWLGLIQPVKTLLSSNFLILCGLIHVVSQGYAYRMAVNNTRREVNN